MSERKCFLNNCTATIADWLNAKCKCVVCAGQNKENCEALHNEHKFKIQQLVCAGCQNCKGA